MRDLTSALRFLLRTPMFTCAAVVPFALGLAVSAVVFSFVNGVFFKPLDVPNASELARVTLLSERGQRIDAAILGDHVAQRVLRARYTTISQISGSGWGETVARWRMSTRQVSAERVVGSYFDALGVNPQAGRPLGPADDDPSAPAAVVISGRLWQTWLGRSPDAIGDSLSVGGRLMTIVGIMPSSFRGARVASNIQTTDIWFPSRVNPSPGPEPGMAIFFLFARLKPGVTVARANAEFHTIHRVVDRPPTATRSYPPNSGLILERGVIPPLPVAAYGLIGAVLATNAVVLAIVATCLGSLLLARMSARRGELAIRLMLGGGEAAIRRLLAAEVVAIALIAGVAGTFAAWGFVSLLPENLLPEALFQISIDWSPDWRVYAYSLGAMTAIAYALVRGLAAHLAGLDALAVVSSAAGSGGATPRQRLTHSRLIATQIACSMVLLVLAGLFVRTTVSGLSFEPGFDARGVGIGWVDHNQQGHDDARRRLVNQRLEDALQAVPGVSSAAVASQLPGNRSGLSAFLRVDDGTRDVAHYRHVSPDFFATIRLALVKGRAFSRQEAEARERFVVVSESVASKLWPRQDFIGRLLQLAGQPSGLGNSTIRAEEFRVIGVVADVEAGSGDPRDQHFIYLPFESSDLLRPAPRVAFLVRAGSDRDAVRAIQTAVEQTHPELAVSALSMREEVARTVPLLRRFSVVLAALGIFGMVIALVSLYGVIAYIAQQRYRELAIRKALGATPVVLWQMISREALGVLLRGVVPGLLASVLVGLALSRYVFVVRSVDAMVLAFVTVCVLATGLLASMMPFRRAVHSDPYAELRDL